MDAINTGDLTARAILMKSWRIYRERFFVIAAVVMAIWMPLMLISVNVDANVFDGDFQKSWRFARLLDNLFGIIAVAAVTFIGREAWAGQRAGIQNALANGFQSWGRMFWTRLLSRLAVVLGFLLLIVPGVYLLVRLSLAVPVTVQERVSGVAAMRRSFALTDGRYWLFLRLGLILLALFVPPLGLMAAMELLPGLDQWIAEILIGVAVQIVFAFGTVVLVTAYSHFTAVPPPMASGTKTEYELHP